MINTVDENVTPGISVQAPAPAVSSVKVVAAQIKVMDMCMLQCR